MIQLQQSKKEKVCKYASNISYKFRKKYPLRYKIIIEELKVLLNRETDIFIVKFKKDDKTFCRLIKSFSPIKIQAKFKFANFYEPALQISRFNSYRGTELRNDPSPLSRCVLSFFIF